MPTRSSQLSGQTYYVVAKKRERKAGLNRILAHDSHLRYMITAQFALYRPVHQMLGRTLHQYESSRVITERPSTLKTRARSSSLNLSIVPQILRQLELKTKALNNRRQSCMTAVSVRN